MACKNMRLDEIGQGINSDFLKKMMRKSSRIDLYRDMGNDDEPAKLVTRRSLRKSPGYVLSWKSREESISWRE